jgi:hypothetical protein
MSTYEEQRKKQIAKNKALFEELRLQHASDQVQGSRLQSSTTKPQAKRRKIETVPTRPQRNSARIAASDLKPIYNNEKVTGDVLQRAVGSKKRAAPWSLPTPLANNSRRSKDDIAILRDQWSSWKPTAQLSTRDENGTFHFESHLDFVPNKSPAELMREGCFGGTYWRPLYSKILGITIEDDWKELPSEWIEGLHVDKVLTNRTYNPEVNKFRVASGQTIEEWEAAGWINHEYDVRGWFQWYCRFFLGRRCADDERQISRWKKCVGETGRWRTILLKKYQAAGIRTVADEGEEEIEGVSPVIHQTCHHWAWEIRQEVLDAWYRRS